MRIDPDITGSFFPMVLSGDEVFRRAFHCCLAINFYWFDGWTVCLLVNLVCHRNLYFFPCSFCSFISGTEFALWDFHQKTWIVIAFLLLNCQDIKRVALLLKVVFTISHPTLPTSWHSFLERAHVAPQIPTGWQTRVVPFDDSHRVGEASFVFGAYTPSREPGEDPWAFSFCLYCLL